ncbi:MAG: BatA domain-containing protein, partial [Halobacteriaceae archaeon]
MVLGVNLGSMFLQPYGLYGLLSAIPLILLYLIRPKPKEQEIPSLMFFLKEQGVEREKNFFKRFSKDLLFWLQLLILITLSIAAAKPYIE